MPRRTVSTFPLKGGLELRRDRCGPENFLLLQNAHTRNGVLERWEGCAAHGFDGTDFPGLAFPGPVHAIIHVDAGEGEYERTLAIYQSSTTAYGVAWLDGVTWRKFIFGFGGALSHEIPVRDARRRITWTVIRAPFPVVDLGGDAEQKIYPIAPTVFFTNGDDPVFALAVFGPAILQLLFRANPSLSGTLRGWAVRRHDMLAAVGIDRGDGYIDEPLNPALICGYRNRLVEINPASIFTGRDEAHNVVVISDEALTVEAGGRYPIGPYGSRANNWVSAPAGSETEPIRAALEARGALYLFTRRTTMRLTGVDAYSDGAAIEVLLSGVGASGPGAVLEFQGVIYVASQFGLYALAAGGDVQLLSDAIQPVWETLARGNEVTLAADARTGEVWCCFPESGTVYAYSTVTRAWYGPWLRQLRTPVQAIRGGVTEMVYAIGTKTYRHGAAGDGTASPAGPIPIKAQTGFLFPTAGNAFRLTDMMVEWRGGDADMYVSPVTDAYRGQGGDGEFESIQSRLTVLKFQSGAWTDYSAAAGDGDPATFVNLNSLPVGAFLYVGYRLPVHIWWFGLIAPSGTVPKTRRNTAPAALSAEVYDPETLNWAALSVRDGTAVGGVSLAGPGSISVTRMPDRWGNTVLADAPAGAGTFPAYWVRFKWSAQLSAGAGIDELRAEGPAVHFTLSGGPSSRWNRGGQYANAGSATEAFYERSDSRLAALIPGGFVVARNLSMLIENSSTQPVQAGALVVEREDHKR